MDGDGAKKLTVVISKGSLDGIYPGLIIANGAREERMESNLFFTFFGLEAIVRKRMDHIKMATVGNPAMHLPTWLGAVPGMSAMASARMLKKMDTLGIPPVPEFIEMAYDAGVKMYACKATVDMFGLKREDFCDQLEAIIPVSDFFKISMGAQIIFT